MYVLARLIHLFVSSFFSPFYPFISPLIRIRTLSKFNLNLVNKNEPLMDDRTLVQDELIINSSFIHPYLSKS